MGDLVNLGRFRKDRARAERAAEAERNRAAFGRTREEREASADRARRAEAKLDAHRREAPPAAPGPGAPDGDASADGAPGDGPRR